MIIETILVAAVLAQTAPLPKHNAPEKNKNGEVVVGLCDGETTAEVKGVKDPSKMTKQQAQAVSNDLMQKWQAKNPNAKWDPPGTLMAQAQVGANKDQAAKSGTAKQDPTQAGTYQNFTARDEAVWAASTEQFVAEGKRVFHDAKAFDGTISVSCDMCHPDASNTHPETYPKYQVQLGRVAMLRDMINWCIENPTRGKALTDDDPRLRAMEAYIYASRKGVKLEYGKH